MDENQKEVDPRRKGFEQALEANPKDWDLRLIYADYLEEQGEEILAYGQRWQAEKTKRPFTHGNQSWHWYDVSDLPTGNNGLDPESDLLKELYQQLTKGSSANTSYFRYYNSLQEAESDLAQAVWAVEVLQVQAREEE